MSDMTEIETVTAQAWIDIGSIWVTETGEENSYYENEFGMTFYCKNYPTGQVGPATALERACRDLVTTRNSGKDTYHQWKKMIDALIHYES